MLRAQDLNPNTQEEEVNGSLGGQPALYSETLLQNNSKTPQFILHSHRP